MLHCRFDSPTLPSEKTARTGDKAKPLVRCANGFAATAEARRIAANIANLPVLLNRADQRDAGKLGQREKKIELTRILLQLSDGTLRRICSFGNPKDKLDDPYLKLVFPDLHGQPLQRTLQNSRWEIEEMEVAPDGMSEFSYHYKGGIAHFKDTVSSRIDQDWVVPKIQKSPCLHLLRFLIFSLAWSKPFPTSKLSSRDFVMPRPFDGRARCIEFWLSNKRETDLRVVADSEGEEVQMYEFQLDDLGHYMHITDGYWVKPHLISPDSNFEIFRFSNPTTLVSVASYKT